MAVLVTRPRLALLVGAPRSGTTWLQSMLGAHRQVATPQETDLFSRYVQPLAEAWAWQLRGSPDDWAARRYKGLPAVLRTEEFNDLVRGVINRVLDGVSARAPEADVVLEKSPAHSLCADVVADFASETRVIHLVRDGRDVASSLVHASRVWGRGWAPSDLRAGAATWVRHVQGGRRYRLIGFLYREVRYESLVSGDPAVLAELFDFLGVDVTEDECAAIRDSFSLERMRRGEGADPILIGGEFAEHARDRAEPEGFFGEGGAGGWRDSWETRDRLLFQAVAGAELEHLGYEPDGRWAAGATRTASYLVEVAARRAVGRAARGIGRSGDRITRGLP